MEEKKKVGRPKGIGNVSSKDWPHPLLDAMRETLKLQSDGELSRYLGVQRSSLSKFRHGTNKINGDFIIRVYKATGWPIEKVESYLREGDRS